MRQVLIVAYLSLSSWSFTWAQEPGGGALSAQAADATKAVNGKAGEKERLERKELLGAWILAGKPGDVVEPQPGARMKFMGEKHWAITESDAETGRVIWHHGGTYTLEGNKLTEKVLYANESTGNLVGKEFLFTLTLEGDSLTWIGEGNPWTSVWKRAGKSATASPSAGNGDHKSQSF